MIRCIRAFRAVLIVSSVCLLESCVNFFPADAGVPANASSHELFYVTDRNPVGENSRKHFFGSERGELSFGIYSVSQNEESANNGATKASRSISGKMMRSAPKSDVHMSISEKAWVEWKRELAGQFAGYPDDSALVYIHGYAKSFVEAADEAASFSTAIEYQGVPILYSWPSGSSPLGYSSDLAAVAWSTFYLEQLLNQLETLDHLRTIHLVAHSLGSKALLDVLVKKIEQSAKSTDQNWRFGEVVLIAPDVEKEIFIRDYLPRLENSPSRLTIYISSHDIPLKISGSLHGVPRLGDARNTLTHYPGVETIDVSQVSSFLRGHSYYRKDADVVSDIGMLINQRLGAEDRPLLVPREAAGTGVWSLIKQ